MLATARRSLSYRRKEVARDALARADDHVGSEARKHGAAAFILADDRQQRALRDRRSCDTRQSRDGYLRRHDLADDLRDMVIA